MEFNLKVPVVSPKNQIGFQDKLCFVGSCFSDEIGNIASTNGLKTLSNPLGTIFHPSPLARIIGNAVSGTNKPELLEHNNLVYDWDSSHLFNSKSKADHLLKIQQAQNRIKRQFEGKSWLFITLGTSIGYELKQNQIIVANCHKQNESLFNKVHVSAENMYSEWTILLRELYNMNPEINVVFTVSPVRHVKDGLVSNNQSKSRLFILIDKLKSNFPISYFPSYEIIVDGLRDYRFYKKDLIHPNEQAIDFVWSHFVKTYFSNSNAYLLKRIEKLKAAKNHQLMTNDDIEIVKLKSWISKETKKIEEELGKGLNL